MSPEKETALRSAFDSIDRIRRRVLIGGWLAVVVTLGSYARFYLVSQTGHDVERLVGASVTALTCLIAWVGFAVILIVVRMTTRILRAIDLALR